MIISECLFYDIFIEWLTTVNIFDILRNFTCLLQSLIHIWLQMYEIYSWLIVQIIILIIITIAQPHTCLYITDERASTRKSNLIYSCDALFLLLIDIWNITIIMSSLSLLFVVDEWCVMLCNVSHEMEHVGITIDIKPPRNRK